VPFSAQLLAVRRRGRDQTRQHPRQLAHPAAAAALPPRRPPWCGPRACFDVTGQSNTFRTVIPSKGALPMIFFSNRLGCLGSVVVSIVLTVIVLVVFHVL